MSGRLGLKHFISKTAFLQMEELSGYFQCRGRSRIIKQLSHPPPFSLNIVLGELSGNLTLLEVRLRLLTTSCRQSYNDDAVR